MRFRLGMPGVHHIPPADDHVPGAATWSTQLRAPDFHRILAALDELHYDSIAAPEHLGMPYHEVPRLGPYWMDALSVLSFIAGATTRLRMATSVLVAPYHHPLPLAKALATIDVLSGGRVEVSVGVGHAVREFEVLGVPYSARGSITDETLEAMLEMWTSDEPSFHGRHFQIDGLAFEPKPVQQPRPPIFIGGNSEAALRRAARYDGWETNPVGFSLGDLPGKLDYLRAQPDFAAKEETFQIHWVGSIPGIGLPVFSALSEPDRKSYAAQLAEGLNHLGGMGVTAVSAPVPVTGSISEYLDFARWFDEEVVVPLR
jgi:probable F420-dependent oxidoreductase